MRSELFVTFTAEPAHTLLPIQPESSPRRECRAERLAHMRTVQPGVVALLWAARYYLEIRKNRPRLRQQRADLLLEYFQVGEFMHRGIARRPREAAKVHAVATGDRMAAIRLVGAVVAHEVEEIGRRRRRDSNQAAEIHEQAAVAIEHDDAPVGPPQRQPERVRGGEPHGAVGQVVERMRPDV